MTRKTSSTKLRVDAKVTSFNRTRLPLSPGQVVPEGVFVTSAGVLSGVANPYALLTWSEDTRSDAYKTLVEQDSGLSVDIETGGMAGIIGNGLVVALPVNDFDGTATPGYWVESSSTGVPTGVAPAALVAGAINHFVYGVVVKVEGGLVYFTFNSTATLYATA